ncbi:hypothetical protein PVK06_043644 [Gossypium arboreum]|uniref:Uncharacterized protein n=1 Tax=Gossypium arboreum TaxID=29729 RepID=A0ABR0MR30_GOSAR|nr:hypothetical protein PVK06_043644 [Gossypium arboreum]
MDTECKQGREKSSVSLEHEMVQETAVKVSLPTSGNNNLKLGTEALTQLVREVLEEVFEARVKAYGETLQARCLECTRKRDHNPLKCVFCTTIAVERQMPECQNAGYTVMAGTRACERMCGSFDVMVEDIMSAFVGLGALGHDGPRWAMGLSR